MAPKMVPMYHPRCALTCSTLFHQFGATRPTYGTKMIILGFFWGSPKAPLTTETAPMHHQGCALTCSTLFHQFGATSPANGPKRPFLAVLDPVWPYIWPKWLEQEWCPLEQVNPYQNEAENIIGCHGFPTSKKNPR